MYTWIIARRIVLIFVVCLSMFQVNAEDDDTPLRAVTGRWNVDGSLIALGLNSGEVRLYDGLSYKLIETFQFDNPIETLVWHPTNPHLLAVTNLNFGTFGSSLFLIDVAQSSVDIFLDNYQLIGAFDWSPDGNQLVVGTNIVFESYTQYSWREMWDLSSRTLVSKAPSSNITDIAWSPDGEFLAITYLDDKFSPVVIGLNTANNNKAFKEHTSMVTRIVWSPQGNLIATAGDVEDQTVRIWKVEDGTVSHVFTDVYASDLAWCPDNACVATASTSVQLLYIDTGEILNLGTFDNGPSTIDFSPYGGRLLFAGNSSMQRTGNRDATEQLIDGLHIIVPAPTLERLNAIAEMCVRDAPTLSRAVTGLTSEPVASLDALPDFIAQVESLPAETIPAACRADLLAVAEAITAQGE